MKRLMAVLVVGVMLLSAEGVAAAGKTSPVVRIGYFANVTHAPALVAKERGLVEKALAGQGTKVEWIAFNAGPSVIEAMKGKALDLSYIGPSPAISGFASTKGTLLKVIAGSTANGAQLIVKPTIRTVEDLRGKSLASPQLGNTQDVALRAWLGEQGLKTSVAGGGDVLVIPTENAQSLTLFQRGDIDGAWVPEPWASRLVLDGGGRVFLDEKDLWPKKLFLTTHLIASSTFLTAYPETVRSVLRAHAQAIDFIAKNPDQAKDAVQNQIAVTTGKRLDDAVINRAWSNLKFRLDPLANSLVKNAEDAVQVGLLTNLGARGLSGIYDLRLLNQLQKAAKRKPFPTAGLGQG